MKTTLLRSKHIQFLRRCIDVLPESCESLDASRLALLYFVVSGLDILNALDEITPERKRELIDWIYSLQIRPKGDGVVAEKCPTSSGFRGSFASMGSASNKIYSSYDVGHVAMTYSALSCLTILGDDLSQVDDVGILNDIKACQLRDGSFCGSTSGSENDMRFVYCAAVCCNLLNNFSCTNVSTLVYGSPVKNYDGGFGQTPGNESHGGSTYCAIATLHILGRLMDESVLSKSELNRLKRWCAMRQNEGFFGRPNKPDDSCYTFWIGASLQLLDSMRFIDSSKAIHFTLSTQNPVTGGFGKYSEGMPDLLHTYLSLAGLSVLGYDRLQPIYPSLNVTQRSFKAVKREINAS